MSDETSSVAAPPPARGKNWFGRNWKWLVPLGCFGFLAVFVLFIGGIVALVFGAMKSSDVYKSAVTQAKNHPAVIEALGEPVREGLFVSGTTDIKAQSGEAELSIPLVGSKGKGTLFVVATKSRGEWSYSKLVVEIARTGERINLLEEINEIETL